MDGNVVLIIVGLIGIAIGFALGVAFTSLREPRQERREVRELDTSQIERRIRVPVARPPAAATEATSPPAPAAEATPVSFPNPSSPNPGSPTATPLTGLPTALPQSPSVSTVDVLARVLTPDLRPPEPPPLSIAAQVDEVLQEMLQNSPLASRHIRLTELPTKGVVVMVGLDRYEGVEAVPDEDVRQMIRLAVAEWERRVAQ